MSEEGGAGGLDAMTASGHQNQQGLSARTEEAPRKTIEIEITIIIVRVFTIKAFLGHEPKGIS